MRLLLVILAALAVACDPPSDAIQPAIGYPPPAGGGAGGSGDITSVGVTSPISGGGTSGAVTVSLSTTGCIAGEAWIYDGANWGCTTVFDGDITGVTAGRGLTGTATSGTATIATAHPNAGARCYDE